MRKGERGLSGAILYGWRQTEARNSRGDGRRLAAPAGTAACLDYRNPGGKDLAIGSRYIDGG